MTETGPTTSGAGERAPGKGDRGSAGWRAAALFLVTAVLAVFEPTVMIGLPFVVLLLVLPDVRLPALLAAGVVVFLVVGARGEAGFHYVERAWALLLGGWFAALTVRWPSASFTPRALGALGGAAATAAAILSVRPGWWDVLDWIVADRIQRGVAALLEALLVLRDRETVPASLAAMMYEAADTQAWLFPAVLGLSSMSALGVAWWLHRRLARGESSGLAPLREFRFDDQFVWIFLAGLGLALTVGSAGWARAGWNVAAWMGALYALRGAAVALDVTGRITVVGALAIALGLLFLAPVLLVSALMVGLGDTWLDFRSRTRKVVGP